MHVLSDGRAVQRGTGGCAWVDAALLGAAVASVPKQQCAQVRKGRSKGSNAAVTAKEAFAESPHRQQPKNTDKAVH